MEMADNIQLNSTDLDSLIRRNLPFAIYRLPGQTHPTMIVGEVTQYEDLAELDHKSGFVIAPFHISKQHPVICITPHGVPVKLEITASESLSPREPQRNAPTTAYCKCFGEFKTALCEGDFSKLVLSRRMERAKGGEFSLTEVYAYACRQYPDSYVFVCYTSSTGVWLGCTPEILLSGRGQEWYTVALAGTQPLTGDTLPTEWSEKNREEQGYVSSYIRDLLHKEGYTSTEKGPYTVRAGALAHLKTEFHFRMTDNRHLGKLLRQLHPTPAVCGLPKAEAQQFILDHEGYDRAYYSGFVGMLSADDSTHLYVNLRCMNIDEEQLHLYAGGGLVTSSEMEDEWRETENKMQTLLNII